MPYVSLGCEGVRIACARCYRGAGPSYIVALVVRNEYDLNSAQAGPCSNRVFGMCPMVTSALADVRSCPCYCGTYRAEVKSKSCGLTQGYRSLPASISP